MSEKEEVLRQISEIKSHLVDKETFFPYNYHACYIWATIAVILTFGMTTVYESSILVGTSFVSFFMLIGFTIEHNMVKKINKNYDIEDCTNRQAFIVQNFVMTAIFSILISTVLAMHQLYSIIMLSWLFLVSLGYFSIGFILNIKRFTQLARFNIISSFILLTIGIYWELIIGLDSLFLTLTQTVTIFGLAIAPAWIARQQIAKEKEGIGV
ncbi:MAG: hypothetical protein KAG56_00725 [Sulfurovaceae bacterium]|nr:hypothetical protein [Sulfurovaceae bacterium]